MVSSLVKIGQKVLRPSCNTGDDCAPIKSNVAPLLVRIVICAMFLAYIAAVLGRTPLLYDGANLFVQVVNDGYPCGLWLRHALVLAHWPTIWAAHWSGQLEPAIFVFCSIIAAGPILGVVLSWLTVRSSKPALFVWPVFGIALTGIFAQVFRIGENLMACELAWPLLLGVLVPINARRGVFVVLLGLLMVNLHPVAVSFLIGVGTIAVLQAFLASKKGLSSDAEIFLRVASALLLMAAVRLTMAVLWSCEYEISELRPERLSEHLKYVSENDLWIASAVSLLPAFCLLLSSFSSKKVVVRVLCAFSVVLTVATGVYAIWWSTHFNFWYQSWFYLRFLFLILSPLMTFAVVDSFKSKQLSAFRASLCVQCAFFFLVTACIHGFIYSDRTEQLKQTLKNYPLKVVDMSRQSWCDSSPFGHWSMVAYSILIQGRNPEKVVMPHELVSDARKYNFVRLANWESHFSKQFENRFFHLPDLREEEPNL